MSSYRSPRTHRVALRTAAGGCLALIASAAAAADLTPKGAAIPYVEPSAYDWTGFYLGGHIGYAWGNADWTGTTAEGQSIASGSLGLSQGVNFFDEGGSWFEGLQIGYNWMLPNRFVIGAEADATFPAYPKPITGLSIGGTSTFASRSLGGESYGENVFASGTVRARIGYAPDHWLYYATGGLAWTSDKFTLTQLPTGASESSFMARLGWAAGAGIEGPLIPHWSVRLEYLYTSYGNSTVSFPEIEQRFGSDLSVQELRVGLNYRFDEAGSSAKDRAAQAALDPDSVNFHAQATFVEQGYPPIHSPYEGPNSLPGGGEGRETIDLTLFAGFRLWQGAESTG